MKQRTRDVRVFWLASIESHVLANVGIGLTRDEFSIVLDFQVISLDKVDGSRSNCEHGNKQQLTMKSYPNW